MHLDSATVPRLLAWCSANGVHIDSRLELVQDALGFISVVARTDIDRDSALVTVPKTAILSIRTCSVAEWFRDATELWHTKAFALAAALCVELHLGLVSRFYGYLQSLPTEIVDIGHLWEPDSPEMRWMRGTPAFELIRQRDILNRARAFFNEQMASRLAEDDELQGIEESEFVHAYSLVSSRSFIVDAFHGMAMVPIADAFNHTDEFSIQMQTDYQVCSSCGSLFECEHDREDGDLVPDIIIAPERNDVNDTCDMVTTSNIRAGDEVFNTYDADGLSNTLLLARYGFVLPGNGTGTECAMEYTIQELMEIHEFTPPSSSRVRLALQYLIEERRALPNQGA